MKSKKKPSKSVVLPNKGIDPVYSYGSLEFARDKKNYNQEIFSIVQLPKWAADAIEAYAQAKAEEVLSARLGEIRNLLGIN